MNTMLKKVAALGLAFLFAATVPALAAVTVYDDGTLVGVVESLDFVNGSATLSGSEADIDLSVADINSGTIDGVTIGGSSAATGTFSTLTLGGVPKTSWGSVVSPWEDGGTTTYLTSAPSAFVLTHSSGDLAATGFTAGTADITLENGQVLDGGTNNAFVLTENSDSLTITATGNDFSIDSSDGGVIFALTDATDGTVDIQTNNDTDDYIQFSTSSNQPLINFVGANGKITAASGTIDFDNENLTTTGTLGAGATTVTSLLIGDETMARANDDEFTMTSNDNDITLRLYGFEAKDAILGLDADQGDDNADTWFLKSIASDNDFHLVNHTTVLLTVSSAGNILTAGDLEINGTTPVLTMGDAGEEDVTILFDGNADDWYIAQDDSADDLLIGYGSTVGTTPRIAFADDSLQMTLGDATAADLPVVWDGNAQDFYIGLDDSADDLVVGLGSTVGTTPALSVDENQDVEFHQNVRIDELNFAADGEASDTYVITLAPAPAAYTTGMMIIFTATTANTGACTVNVNGLGAKSLKMLHDQDPADNYIEATSVVMAVYDGTSFLLISPDCNP